MRIRSAMCIGRTYNLVPASLSRDNVLLDTCSGSAILNSRNLNPRASKRCLSEMRTINVLHPGASALILFSAVNLAARRNAEGSANCSATSSLAGMSLIPIIGSLRRKYIAIRRRSVDVSISRRSRSASKKALNPARCGKDARLSADAHKDKPDAE